MKKHLFSFCYCLALLSACSQLSDFSPKPLHDNAKNFSIVRESPYACRVIGAVEGRDHEQAKVRFPRLDKLRESAFNDLRNNAAALVQYKQNLMLRITHEYATCFIQDCDNLKDDDIVKSYHVAAQILECSDLHSLHK